MKSFIVPVAIIAGQIVFFVNAEGKEFTRHNDVLAIQNNYIESPRKEASIFVSHANPVTVAAFATFETKDIADANPTKTESVETEASGESKSDVEGKSGVETRHAETNSTAGTSKSSPYAVPVITQEEAIKVNEEAIRFQQTEKNLAETNEAKHIAVRSVPAAIPVLAPEEAIKANKEAIKFQRNKTIQAFFKKIGINNNRIHFVLSLLPLLLIVDVLLFKRKKKSNKFTEYFSLPRRMRILFSVSLLAFGLLVFVPWSVYFGNSLQFPFIFQDFVNWNLRVLTISIVGASIVLLLIPPKISDYIVALIAGLGLCIYLQVMFMNINLGEMNGVEPDWEQHRILGIINIIIWIVLFFAPCLIMKIFSKQFKAYVSYVTGGVLFLEIVAISSMVFSASPKVWSRTESYYADGANQFLFSNEKNIIVFLFDMLGSGFVDRCFEEYPETKDIVKDFIWYKDARSNYNYTFPGLHHELTGTYIYPAKNLNDLYDHSWHSPSAKSFYKQICDAGYDARLYCRTSTVGIGPLEYFQEYFSNIYTKDIIYYIDKDILHKSLVQISLFSSVPYIFKKHFFYSEDSYNNVVETKIDNTPNDNAYPSIPKTNEELIKKLHSEGIYDGSGKPVLSINYTVGAHSPWVLDEKCNRVKEPFDKPTPTTRSCFFVVSEVIKRLKDANIYDKTAILIFSDHGGNISKFSTPFDMTFMIKPFHENKAELTYDYSRFQSIDILPTLLNLACGNKANYDCFDGYVASNIPADRKRKVYRIEYNNNFPRFWGDEQDRTYIINCLLEYDFVDVESFRTDTNSSSFVRFIPLKKDMKDE